jgi:hypothetical protein
MSGEQDPRRADEHVIATPATAPRRPRSWPTGAAAAQDALERAMPITGRTIASTMPAAAWRRPRASTSGDGGDGHQDGRRAQRQEQHDAGQDAATA